MIDFEQSMMDALDQVYLVVPQKGMSQLYMNDEEFRTNIRITSALSFVPIADAIQAFDALNNHAGNQEQVILDYIESNYIGELRRRRGRCLVPRFPYAM